MTDNKLTDEQIIQDLLCCIKGKCFSEKCTFSKYIKDEDISQCTMHLAKEAFDLINRQKAEIKRLEGILDKRCDVCTAVTYARKEFAERLKEMATSTFYEERKYVDTEDIDNLLEERMVNLNEQINSTSTEA